MKLGSNDLYRKKLRCSKTSLPIGTTFIVILKVYDSTRSATSKGVSVTVVDDSYPTVAFSADLDAKKNADMPVTVAAQISARQSGTVTWSLALAGSSSSIDLAPLASTSTTSAVTLDSSNSEWITFPASITISPSVLESGSSYLFSIMYTQDGSNGLSAMSTIQIEINMPPMPGVFSVVPNTGDAMLTAFKFKAGIIFN